MARLQTKQGIQKTTLVFPLDPDKDQVLLGMKKRGFGAGWWNGFGGKLEDNETYKQNAVREVYEECQLTVHSLKLAARLLFYFDNTPTIVSAVYTCSDYSGEPTETEEMKPQWFKLNELPLDQMWGGDKYWVPQLFDSKTEEIADFAIYFTNDNTYLSWRRAEKDEIDPLFSWSPAT